MDNTIYGFFFRIKKTLSFRTFTLQTTGRTLLQSSKNKLKIKIFFLILLTLMFGTFSYSQSLTSAKETFLSEHPPSLRTWVSVIENKEFKELKLKTDSNLIEESLPFINKKKDELFLDQSEKILVLVRPEGNLFFKHQSTSFIPTHIEWQKIGRSWEGLEKLQNKAFTAFQTTHNNQPLKKNKFTDPKLLNY